MMLRKENLLTNQTITDEGRRIQIMRHTFCGMNVAISCALWPKQHGNSEISRISDAYTIITTKTPLAPVEN
jgi:hypothetical protein